MILKFSLCTTGFKEQRLEDVVKLVSQLGLDGIEIWTGHIDEYLERNGSLKGLKSLVDSYNLTIPAISPYTYFSKSEEESSESTLIIQRTMEIAAQLDCPIVRTFVGHFPSSEVSSTQWNLTLQYLKQVLQLTNHYGVNLGIEIHNNTFADTIESINAIVKELYHPRIKLIFDGFNLYVDRLDQMEALNTLITLVDHVHLKNFIWNHSDWNKSIPTSIFGGDVNQRLFLNRLLESQYRDYVSLEYFGTQAEKCIRESIKELKEFGLWNEN